MSDHYESVKKFSNLHSRIYNAAKKHGLIVPGQVLPENSAVMSFIRDACDEALKEDPQQQRKFALLQAAATIFTMTTDDQRFLGTATDWSLVRADRLLEKIEACESTPVQEPTS